MFLTKVYVITLFSIADELNALQNEQDMPIEELLKMYGYNNSQPQAKDEEEDTEEQEEVTESKDAEESDKVEKGEPTKDIVQENRTDEDQEQEDSVIVHKGEKRSSSTPPPAKKARSELAKYVFHKKKLQRIYFFLYRFYEAAVEGRSLRSSAGVVEEPEEEEEEPEEEEDVEIGKDYSWKKTIMIGTTYQASVPDGLNNYDDTPPYENEDKLLWDPSRMSEDLCKEYLAKSGELQGATGAMGVNGIPTGSHVRDDEQALLLLLQCGYNVEEALRRRRMNAVPPADTMSLWSEEECKAFETGLRVYGKDFHSIQNQKVGTRAVGELVQFYYLWKKTERHDVFANSFRIEKKKYTLHPGTTDYMERYLMKAYKPNSLMTYFLRFMDEQDLARDRSVSPNYHSLIYGDTKRKSESKPEPFNGSDRLESLSADPEDATLAEATTI